MDRMQQIFNLAYHNAESFVQKQKETKVLEQNKKIFLGSEYERQT